MLAACGAAIAVQVQAEALATRVLVPTQRYDELVSDAVVESTRQTEIAAQVPGRVTALYVKAGDRVGAGQPLVTVDQRAADQQLAAVRAQAAAAQADLDVARRELERTQTLFARKYVSQAALDRAQARYRAAAAISTSRLAQTRAAAVEPTLHSISAPYAAIVARVDVELGSMAMPGTPLVTVLDPNALRAVATVPQSRVALLQMRSPARIELPDLPEPDRWQTASSVTILPLADPQSDSIKIRLALPPSTSNGIRPGMFARAHFPIGAPHPRLMVPLSAVVRRTEVDAVYVVADDGSATLRQVRLGETSADQVEVLAGLSFGERIALEPLAAAKR